MVQGRISQLILVIAKFYCALQNGAENIIVNSFMAQLIQITEFQKNFTQLVK